MFQGSWHLAGMHPLPKSGAHGIEQNTIIAPLYPKRKFRKVTQPWRGLKLTIFNFPIQPSEIT